MYYGRIATTGVGGSATMVTMTPSSMPVLAVLSTIVACTTLFAAALAIRNLWGLFRS